MILYTKKNIELDTSDYEYISHGNCANIFRKKNEALKIYLNECKDIYRLKKGIFKLIKKLNDPNIVKLYEYYYKMSYNIYKVGSMDAYSMDYIENEQYNLIELEKKQLIDMVKSLDETIQKLSNKGIVLRDMKKDHLLLTNNRFLLIDPDMFYHSIILSRDNIYHVNKNYIISILNKIMYDEMNEGKLVENGKIKNEFPLILLIKQDMYSTLTDLVARALNENTLKDELLKKQKRL